MTNYQLFVVCYDLGAVGGSEGEEREGVGVRRGREGG